MNGSISTVQDTTSATTGTALGAAGTTQAGATASSFAVSAFMFALSVLVSLAFGYYLVTDPTRLADAWVTVRSLHFVFQIVLWLIFLPWMLALWVWSLPLAYGLKVVIVVAIMLFANFLLFPRRA